MRVLGRGVLAVFLLSVPAPSLVATGAQPAASVVDEHEDPSRWRLLGSFRGSASSRLTEELNDLLFEMENDGGLYQDLGALTLGLGADFPAGDAEVGVDWDNSFLRRVEPLHATLDPGQPVTGEDLSRYVDIQSIVSRGRLRYGFPRDPIEGDLLWGMVVEGGVSLTLARARQPIVHGRRPLDEIFAERDRDDFQELLDTKPPPSERSLVRLTAEGLAALGHKIAGSFRKTADTERGTIFFQNAADPLTLMYDVGIPVPAELFTAADRRLSVGDRVRQVAFVGVSPLVFGIIKLGYTLFEQRWDRAHTSASETVYRFDLADPEGMASFEALLADGRRMRLHPRRDRPLPAAAEILEVEDRHGRRRAGMLRVSLFSPLRVRDRKTVVSERVETGGTAFQDITVARSRELRKRLGKDQRWKRQFLISSQAGPRQADLPPADAPETAAAPAAGSAAVTLLTGLTDERADGARVRLVADLLARTFGPHAVLDELTAMPPRERTRFFANVRLSFGGENLRYLREAGDEAVWAVLAELLLGSEHRRAWSDAEARADFRKRRVRRRYRQLLAAAGVPPANPTLKEDLSVRGRLRLAGRTARKFHRVQEAIRLGDCVSCLDDAIDKWKYVHLLQMLMFRLAEASEAAAPGYQYEVFTDRMLKPATVSNGRSYDFIAGGTAAEPSGEPGRTEDVLRRAAEVQSDWVGARFFLEPSDARLRAGNLYLSIGGEPGSDAPCWKLRLFSDLRFAPELDLRIDLRRSGVTRADLSLEHALFRLGEPTAVVATPFMTARYYYDVPLPVVSGLEEGRTYTLLLRVLNPQGLPVSEEQQLRFEWLRGGVASTACRQQPAAP